MIHKDLKDIERKLEKIRTKRNFIRYAIPEISQNEETDAADWWTTHKCFNRLENWDRDIELDTFYPKLRLNPCSIGVKIEIECPFCSELKDVSDYGAW